MKVRIFSFPFLPDQGGFDTDALDQFCLDKEILELSAHFFQQERQAYWTLYVRYRLPDSGNRASTSKFKDRHLNEKDRLLVRRLKEYRSEKAKELGWPPYLIFTQKQLMDFATQKMTTLEGFGPVKGFGGKRVQRFGKDILEIIKAFKAERTENHE